MELFTSTLEAQGVEDQRTSERTNCYCCSHDVEDNSALTTFNTESIKVAPSQLCDVTGLAALTSRGFTWSDFTASSKIHTLHFTGVDGTSMVSTGSWGSPSVDSFTGDLDAHGVAGLNLFNAIPADGNALDRVGDADSFIKDFNLWMDEEQITDANNEYSPSARHQVSSDRASSEGLNNKCENDDRRYSGREPGAAGTVENHITHSAIFSQQPGLEGSEK